MLVENKERMQKLKKIGDRRYYQNKLDKAWFQHNISYADFKDLPRKKHSDKAFITAKIQNMTNKSMDLCQCFIVSRFPTVEVTLISQYSWTA